MPLRLIVNPKPLSVEIEAADWDEVLSNLKTNDAKIREFFAINDSFAGSSTETVIHDGETNAGATDQQPASASGKGRGRGRPAKNQPDPSTANAPPPAPVPSATVPVPAPAAAAPPPPLPAAPSVVPAAPPAPAAFVPPAPVPGGALATDTTATSADGIPAFLDRRGEAAPTTAAPPAPPPPPAPAPVAEPEVRFALARKVVDEVKRRCVGTPDGGKAMQDWFVSAAKAAGIVQGDPTFDQVLAVAAVVPAERIGPIAGQLQVAL